MLYTQTIHSGYIPARRRGGDGYIEKFKSSLKKTENKNKIHNTQELSNYQNL